MFYAIPLENRPSWRNPPWMTVLLILVNMLVFWGPQRSEENAQERAARYYAKSSLPALELPAFVDWLERTRSPRAGPRGSCSSSSAPTSCSKACSTSARSCASCAPMR